ncbi:hypothetical protein C9J85_08690 [Haloferax sp. wsp5]|nr:hypothetical protein C9J85_08690 [Haloferax sp. wsp5]
MRRSPRQCSSQPNALSGPQTAVAEPILETAVDVLELPDVEIYLFDRSDNTLRSVGDVDADRSASIGPGGVQRGMCSCRTALSKYPPARASTSGRGRSRRTRSGSASRSKTTACLHRTGPATQRRRTREMVDLLAASAEAALARVDRETTLREREAERREQNRELRRLKQVMPSSAGLIRCSSKRRPPRR